jgi:uncharacterized membrane protein YfcA
VRRLLLVVLGTGFAVFALGAIVAGFEQGDPIALLVGVALGLVGWRVLRRAGGRSRRRTREEE